MRTKSLGDFRPSVAVVGKKNMTLYDVEQVRSLVASEFNDDVSLEEVTVNVHWSRKPAEQLAIKRSESVVKDAEELYALWVEEVKADADAAVVAQVRDGRPF